MKVYTVESFLRDDESLDYESGVIGVYSSKEEAVKRAELEVDKYLNEYGHKRVDEPNYNIIYYCCLDADPDYEKDYANYLVICVEEHEVI